MTLTEQQISELEAALQQLQFAQKICPQIDELDSAIYDLQKIILGYHMEQNRVINPTK